MAFPKNGVIEAPKIVPSAFGLLAVVKPENSANEDHWVRGFSQEWETTLYSATNWDDTDSTDGEVVAAGTPTYYTEIKPFFIEAEELRSGLGFLGLDRIARLKRQLEGVTQHAMEIELWDGAVRKGEDHSNLALSDASVTVVNSGVALSAKRALAAIEYHIGSASDGGEQGIIHMTRDVTALLASNSNMLFHETEKDHLQTMGGTPVIVGSGYSGNGPRIDTATAAITGGNTLTINTSGAHYLVTGDTVKFSIQGENISEGSESDTFTVTKVDADTVTITISGLTNASSESVTGYIQQVGTDSAKWIYATGTVRTYVGDIDVVNDNLAQAYDVSGNANDMRLKAIRPAAVYFDTSIHLAVRVDLTA
jgi:hypothetical protein